MAGTMYQWMKMIGRSTVGFIRVVMLMIVPRKLPHLHHDYLIGGTECLLLNRKVDHKHSLCTISASYA